MAQENLRRFLRTELHLDDLRELATCTNDWKRTAPLLGISFCLLIYYFTITVQAWLSFRSPIPFLDYGSLYASVYAWAHHMNPYLDYPLTFHPKLGVRGLFIKAVNLNPPISLYLFRPLAAFGPITSVELWTLVSVCLFCASLVLIIRANPNPALRSRILLILGMAGVWYTFQLGQIYTILLLLTAVAWVSFKKDRYLTAGIAIGLLCALKPNFLIWPVLLILARHRKAGIWAILTFITASAAPLLPSDGLQTYQQWLAACRRFHGIALPNNSAILAMFTRLDPYLGTTHYFRDIGFGVTVVFLLAITLGVMRRAPGVYATSEVALVASLLAGPISWLGYTIVLIPILYEKKLDSLTRVGWVILCIPSLGLALIALKSPAQYVLLGAPYFYGLVLIGGPVICELFGEQSKSERLPKEELSMPTRSLESCLRPYDSYRSEI